MSWNGVKKQSYEQEIKSWCEEMDIENYTINSQGEIDVDGSVDFYNSDLKDLKKLPYKFGEVIGFFDIGNNKNLTSLKNCPDKVGGYFSCSGCINLNSLEGCPTKVGGNFHCYNCKRKFTEEEVKSLCILKKDIIIIKPF